MAGPSDDQRPRSAVALRYDAARDNAPRVVAQGYGELAERIIEEARRHGVFVHDSPELVGLLMNLDLDEVIPPELYLVVAELLVWLSSLERGEAEALAPGQILVQDEAG
ncbi:flagellar protein FhlB [Mangrovimicrobium sediminis]|uniref:Flagellar biosynthetic protein FlhB n=1 Tax=Mangrovimicrobium sediminis TaxID=2562682 RepID=A0A4Z0M0V3_9GAMM|nr:EscU/YscU/HrcU family type III secretion system export apparatus switch protein [Haliea sp. SAOS-164]TGD73161.1 flagellar protein FhlB [Haliea sp. SAOS-164]